MQQLNRLYDLFLAHRVITTDSRHVPVDSLFFALRGENFNGNEYAADALEGGAAYAIIDDPSIQKGDNYLLVKDSLKTLQGLAAMHREQLSHIPLMAITGTNGKTTTKELINAVLSKKYNVCSTSGNGDSDCHSCIRTIPIICDNWSTDCRYKPYCERNGIYSINYDSLGVINIVR